MLAADPADDWPKRSKGHRSTMRCCAQRRGSRAAVPHGEAAVAATKVSTITPPQTLFQRENLSGCAARTAEPFALS